jgi:SAM-dependent methyltransferase
MGNREYSNYEKYIEHQSGKLHAQLKELVKQDAIYESVVVNRYKNLFDFNNKSIICLGARLGGEVRAFKNLNALAIGIDIEPGEKNEHVLHGDFHQVKFPDGIFDFAFCNAIDHVLYLDLFLSEVGRILKSNGIFLLELAIQSIGRYEVMDTQDITPIKNEILKFFIIDKELNINNNWKGVLLILEKIKTI